MAQVANTRKVFNFRVEIDGVDQWEFQKVTTPEMEIEEVLHGDAHRDVKTPGRIKVGDGVMEKLRPLPTADLFAWNWFSQAQNILTGGGQLPINVNRTIVIKEMSTDGVTTVNRWVWEEVWLKKISQTDFDRSTSDNIIETLTFSVGVAYRL